jgi:two-component system nitrogen regulation sensor histidine kinase GlnL
MTLPKTSLEGQWAMRTLEGLSTSVLLFDDELVLHHINPAAEMLLQESARRALGLDVEQLLPGNELLFERMSGALLRNHPISDREMPIRLPAGSRTIVCCMITPVVVPGGSTELIVEMVPVDRHLRIAREEQLLTQNNATRSLFRGIAHEIKNPLGGLRGAAQLLELELDAPDLKVYTHIIMGEADRLRNLLDRMLGPSLPADSSEVNVHEALSRVQYLVEAEMPVGIVLKTDYDPSLPAIHWNLDQLIQALLNLVRNAAQALGETGTITLRTRSFRQFNIGDVAHRLVIRIEVIDNGPGVPPDLLESIFLPMVTGRAEGSGLGLSIAQTLVQRSGGLIECISEPGNTNFSVYLPIADSKD